MRRKKKQKLIQENLKQILIPDAKREYQWYKIWFQVFNCLEEHPNQDFVNVCLHGLNNHSGMVPMPTHQPYLYINWDVQRYSKEYARCVLWHEIGHGFLHSSYVMDIDLFDEYLYTRRLRFSMSSELVKTSLSNTYSDWKKLVSNSELTCVIKYINGKPCTNAENYITKGHIRNIVWTRIFDIFNGLEFSDPVAYRSILRRFRLHSDLNYMTLLIKDIEADLFVAANISPKAMIRTRKTCTRMDKTTKTGKVFLKSYEKLLQKVLSNDLIQMSLPIYKVNIIMNEEEDNKNESKKECIETAQ